jgi:hypothetical protein
LHALARYRREVVFDALFACASATLLELGRDPRHLGAELGFTAVLHTWTRELRFHPHIHCIVTGGGLSLDGTRWIPSPKKFLFHVDVIGGLFRGKFLDHLRKAHARGAFAGFDEFDDPEGFDRLMRRLASKDWGVYAKRAFGGPEQVYRYLGRYTHRVGIANSRLVSLEDDAVTFRTKNGKTVTVAAVELLRRFVQHVLPPGYIKIRHYGLLAPGNVNKKLVTARTRIASNASPSPVASPSGRAIVEALLERDRRCPRCGIGTLHAQPLPTLAAREPAPFDSS